MAFQIKISLKGSKPPVWRRVLIPETFNFKELHYVIQSAMGWHNSHLFAFRAPGNRFLEIGIPYEEDFGGGETLDAKKIKIKKYLSQEKEKMEYEYDFGDGWLHTVLLEKIVDEKILHPQCLGGKGACPPEDCGGLWGYYELVETVNDPKNPEHEDMLEWLGLEEGEKWDVNAFDKEDCDRRVTDFKELGKFEIDNF